MEYQNGNDLALNTLSTLFFQGANLAQNSPSNPFGSYIIKLGRITGPLLMMFIGNMFLPLGLTWVYQISPFQNFYPILASRASVLKFLARLTIIAVLISAVALTTTANGKPIQNWLPTELWRVECAATHPEICGRPICHVED